MAHLVDAGAPAWAAWAPPDVGRWLSEGLGLPQYSSAFETHEVDGPTLMELTEALLREALGVENALHRKKIVAHIKLLRSAHRPVEERHHETTRSAAPTTTAAADAACCSASGSSHSPAGAEEEECELEDDGASASTTCSRTCSGEVDAVKAVDTHSTIVNCLIVEGQSRRICSAASTAMLDPVATANATNSAFAKEAPFAHELRGPLAIYHGAGATARRAAARSNLEADLELFGGLAPAAALPVSFPSSAAATTSVPAAQPPLPGPQAALRPRRQRMSAVIPSSPGASADQHLGNPRLRRSNSATPVPSSAMSPTGGGGASRQRWSLGGNSPHAAEPRSPRPTIGRACREMSPFHGKLAWQGRQHEVTPGAGAYNAHLRGSFAAKPVPGGAVSQASRFAAPGDLSGGYPSWLQERGR